ncbi:hypothetical protein Nepgr_030013 [Nepenthes gracilis]|uniref:Uncharacterized protein n=1 Tax=Nepenthes gracilis TaxID=150966 RepID=A0AAD3Y5F9_NEPGR|nr:hypothetical protein Nepgr_030013 [Nepenthes gracilis]
MKGLKIPKKGETCALSRNMNAQHMSKILTPQMLKQIGGMGSLMKQMGASKDMVEKVGEKKKRLPPYEVAVASFRSSGGLYDSFSSLCAGHQNKEKAEERDLLMGME